MFLRSINLYGTCWMWPHPSNSGKWRFIGILYKKCNIPGGHCFWEGATSKADVNEFAGCEVFPRMTPRYSGSRQ